MKERITWLLIALLWAVVAATLIVSRCDVKQATGAAPSAHDDDDAGPSVSADKIRVVRGIDSTWKDVRTGILLADTPAGHVRLAPMLKGAPVPACNARRLYVVIFAGKANYRPGPSTIVPFVCYLRAKNELRVTAFIRDPEPRDPVKAGVSSPWVIASFERRLLPGLRKDAWLVLEEIREVRRDVIGARVENRKERP